MKVKTYVHGLVVVVAVTHALVAVGLVWRSRDRRMVFTLLGLGEVREIRNELTESMGSILSCSSAGGGTIVFRFFWFGLKLSSGASSNSTST